MNVEVCEARPDGATRIAVELPDAATLADALAASGILNRLSIGVADRVYGIFGKRAPLDAPLRDGDRVELYRPLQVDPKEARRRRAVKAARKLAPAA